MEKKRYKSLKELTSKHQICLLPVSAAIWFSSDESQNIRGPD